MKLHQVLCSSNVAWTWQAHRHWWFSCNPSLLGNGLSCYQLVISMHLSKIKIVVWDGGSSATTKRGLDRDIWWKLVIVHVAHRHGIWVDQTKVRLWKPVMEEVTHRSRIDWELAYHVARTFVSFSCGIENWLILLWSPIPHNFTPPMLFILAYICLDYYPLISNKIYVNPSFKSMF